MIPTLTTERLTLRAPELRDFEAFAAYRASDRARYVGGPNTRDEAWNQICAIAGQWQMRGYGRWILADKTTDEAMGVAGIYHPEDWPGPEIGWTVFEAAEGKGYAFEAAKASRTYAYETLGWDTIFSCVAPENERSLKLAKRLGCTFERSFEHEALGTLNIWRHPSREALS